MSQTPRTPERNREQEHPSTPATISHTLRAGAVAVVTAPYTISRLLLRTLGLITPGDAPSTNPAVQQLNFELEGGSGSSAVHEGAENARAVNINVVHRNGAGGARQRTTDEILLEGPTTVNEDEDVESPPSLRLSTKGDPDRSPIVLFPNLDTGERSRAEANASCGDTPSDFRDLLAAMEKLHDLVQMLIKNYALLGERLRSLEERRSLRTSRIADSGVDLSDNPFDSTGDSSKDKGEEGYTNKDQDGDKTMLCCASCGIAGVDDMKLKACDGCKSVRYCSDTCQMDHRPQHERECEKRAAELRDKILFKQPESSHWGDCPICFLPLALDPKKSMMMDCCSKVICDECIYANLIREREQKIEHKCPFCRHPALKSKEEADRNRMKRVAANDPVALREEGKIRYKGGDYKIAFEYLTKAAELGDVDAHHSLSVMYHLGEGVEKDEKKTLYHLEEAAIGGHDLARHNLGYLELKNGRLERAAKHWIIAANLGHDNALNALKSCYKDGIISKEDFAAALRGHQAAVDATKSPQREAAEAARAVQKQ